MPSDGEEDGEGVGGTGEGDGQGEVDGQAKRRQAEGGKQTGDRIELVAMVAMVKAVVKPKAKSSRWRGEAKGAGGDGQATVVKVAMARRRRWPRRSRWPGEVDGRAEESKQTGDRIDGGEIGGEVTVVKVERTRRWRAMPKRTKGAREGKVVTVLRHGRDGKAKEEAMPNAMVNPSGTGGGDQGNGRGGVQGGEDANGNIGGQAKG